MSAHSSTRWTVYCDHYGCRREYTDTGISRAEVRKFLRKRGWAVGVGDGPIPSRLDYCPEHKPDTKEADR